VSDDTQYQAPTYRAVRSRGMDPGTKRLALIAGGLGGALVLVIGGSSLFGHHSGVPVVQADVHPVRAKPDNPGGMQVAGANDPILSGESGPQNDKLAPPPETPEPQALHTATPTSPPPSPSATTPEPTPPAAATPPVAAAPPPSSPEVPQAAPAAVPAAAPASAPRLTPVEHKAAPAPAQRGKPAEVQLAAVSTEQAAKSEWNRLVKKFPELASHKPQMIKAERGGHAIWRLRTAGFSDTAQATAFCEHVRAKGGGCSVASF
jgi:hypothetical protein